MARRGRPPKAEKAPEHVTDLGKIKRLVDDLTVAVHKDEAGDDYGGHQIAVKYGYICRIIDELAIELGF